MSTWISEFGRARLAASLLLAVLATGCVKATAPGRATFSLAGRPFVVTGPPGFCVEPDATRIGDDNAFVLLGNCAAITGKPRAAQPGMLALLTATIAEAGRVDAIAGSLDTLAEFFASEAGRRALSRTATADSVEVLETFNEENVFFIHANDTSNGFAPGMADSYWRAYFDLDGRIVAVSVLGFDAAALSRGDSLATLRAFEKSLRGANPAQRVGLGPRAPGGVLAVVVVAGAVPVATVHALTGQVRATAQASAEWPGDAWSSAAWSGDAWPQVTPAWAARAQAALEWATPAGVPPVGQIRRERTA